MDATETKHPEWCDTEACTIRPGVPLSQAWHRSAAIGAPGRLRATAHLRKVDHRSYPTDAFVSVNVDSPLHGPAVVELSAEEARDLGEFLLSLSVRAEDGEL